MADELITVLEFIGEAGSAEKVIAGLMNSLQGLASQTQNLFTPIINQTNQAVEAIQRVTVETAKTAKVNREATDSALSYARAQADLLKKQGDLSGAANTLRTAISNTNKETVAAVRAQSQLVTIEAQLANAASKADTELTRQAILIAKIQQNAGDAVGALKTIKDAQDKLSNTSSLEALRLQLRRTYLETDYTNSPLIGAIKQINAGIGFLRPLLGGTAGTLQTVTGLASQAAQAISTTGKSLETGTKQASGFSNAVKSINDAIQRFRADEGGSASATDFFLNLSKGAAAAGDRIRASLAGIRDSIAGAFSKTPQTLNLGSVSGEASAAAKALESLKPAATGAASGLTSTGAAATGMTVALGAAVLVVASLVVAFTGAVAVTAAVASGLQSIGEAGIKTNAQLETIRIGLTTVIASIADIRNSDGLQLKGIDALNASLPVAADQLRKLRVDALETSATIADIAPAFQAAIGPGLVAGLTIDQIRQNTIKLTQAVTALGLPLDQIKQETRAILSGDINRNTQAAIALGISREAVLQAQKQGKFAEFLEDKLSAAAAAGKLVAQTFAAASSNLQEAGDTFQAVVTEGLFNQLRDKINEVIPQLFDKTKANLISDNFKGIADSLIKIFDTAGERIAQLIDFALDKAKGVSAFLDENRALVDQTIASVDTLIESVLTLSAAIFDAFSPEKKTLLVGIRDVVDSISLSVASLQDEVEEIGARVLYFIQAIVLGIEGPLSSALNFIGLGMEGLNQDVQRLTGSMDAALKRIGEGAKNTEKIEQRIKQAQDRADNFNAFGKMSKEDRELAALFLGGEGLNVPKPTEPPKLEQKNTFRPPKRPAESDGGKAESKARQDAAALGKLLKNQEKEAELTNRRVTEGLRQSLTDRLVSLRTFTELSIENDRNLLEKRLAALDEEEKAAIKTTKSIAEADAKRSEFKLKRAQLEQDADIKAEALRDDLRRSEEKAEEDHQTRLFGIREAARKAVEAAIRASASSGLISNEQAEQRLIEAERARFEERKAILDEALIRAREDVAKRQEINDQLALLAVERVEFETQASQKINQVQRQEAADFISLLRKRIDAIADLRKAQIAAQGAQAALDVQRGTLSKVQADQAEFARRRQLLQLESKEREASIEREAADLKKQVANQAGAAAAIVEIERVKQEQLKAEREKAKAEDSVLQNQQTAVPLAPIFGPEAAERIAATQQILGGAVSVLDQLRIAAQTTADGLLQSMPTIGQVFAQAAQAIVESTASIIASFVSGQAPLRKAAAALYAAALAPLKNYLLKKATAEFALASADFAIGNIGGGVKHSLAGAGLAAAAALIDVGGSLIAGGGGSSGGAAGAAIAGSGSAPATETFSPRNLAQDTQRSEQQIIILRPEINLRGDLTRGVLEIVHEDMNLAGKTRNMVQEIAQGA